MRIEHTRTHGFNGSPSGTTWWTVGYNGKQYVVRQKTNNQGFKSQYELLLDSRHGVDIQKSVLVKLTPSSAIVAANDCDFIDITLAVQLARFIQSEVDNA